MFKNFYKTRNKGGTRSQLISFEKCWTLLFRKHFLFSVNLDWSAIWHLRIQVQLIGLFWLSLFLFCSHVLFLLLTEAHFLGPPLKSKVVSLSVWLTRPTWATVNIKPTKYSKCIWCSLWKMGNVFTRYW